jgi:hypothetical protein
MPATILSVGYDIPGFSENYHEYVSSQSLLDADVIIFKPEKLGHDGGGKPSFSEDWSFRLQESARHWKRELLIALDYGKTVFLFLGKYEVASMRTGRKEVKGRIEINYVADHSNYDFLPVTLPSMTSKGGTAIVFTGDPVFATLWRELGRFMTYGAYLNDKVQRPVFVTKTGERPIGAVIQIKKGHLVLLPLMDYDDDKFVKKLKSSERWTKQALAFGEKLVNALLEIDKSLRSESTATPPPIWVKGPEFVSPQEAQILKAIDETDKQTEELKARERSLQTDLNNEQWLKYLLFETGKSLEAAVISSLRVLGYSAENYDDGELELDQVIISPEGDRFIGECEGKDNAAVNIDKFRQLAENIQSDLQKDDVKKPAIGILFGNGFRLTEPKERKEQFTEKCRASAKRDTILVRTMDLYPVVRYIRETNDQDYMRSCRDAILGGIGNVVSFPAVPSR